MTAVTPLAGARKRTRPKAEVEKMQPLWEAGDVGYLGYRLVLTARLFERRVSALLAEHVALSLPEWRVLAQLGVIPRATVRMLADGAAVDRAEVSRATRRLTANGLILRIENPTDLRSPRFELTRTGLDELERVREPIFDLLRHMVEGIAAADIAAADRVLWAMTCGCVQRSADPSDA